MTDMNMFDCQAGKWRVHLVQPGSHYGANNNVIYQPEDAEKYGMNLPLVEFYDTSQDPVNFPGGQFVGRYYASTLLGLDTFGDDIRVSAENGIGFALDASIPSWRVSPEELGKIGEWLGKACDKEPKDEPARVSLADRANGAKEASMELEHDNPVRDKDIDAR